MQRGRDADGSCQHWESQARVQAKKEQGPGAAPVKKERRQEQECRQAARKRSLQQHLPNRNQKRFQKGSMVFHLVGSNSKAFSVVRVKISRCCYEITLIKKDN